MQKKIIRGKLLDGRGQLITKGYNTSLVAEYNRKDIRVCGFKIKECDQYLICNDRYAINLSISDNSYLGVISASFIDFESKKEITKNIITFLTFGKTKMPSTSKFGDLIVKNSELVIQFINNGKNRRLKLAWNKFFDKENLVVDVKLSTEPQESVVVATAFENSPKLFCYNQKIIGFKADGTVKKGNEEIVFNNTESFGYLNWKRAALPYRTNWYWGAAFGKIENKDFGLNIGLGLGNTNIATENMVFYNGYSYKLENLYCKLSKDKNGKDEYLKNWDISSSDGKLEIKFEPVFEIKNKINLLFCVNEKHEIFGKYSGKVILDDKKELIIKDLFGFIERVSNRG